MRAKPHHSCSFYPVKTAIALKHLKYLQFTHINTHTQLGDYLNSLL